MLGRALSLIGSKTLVCLQNGGKCEKQRQQKVCITEPKQSNLKCFNVKNADFAEFVALSCAGA